MQLFKKHHFDGVIHLAAESHVDRSITDPLDFVKTNVIGTVNLLQSAKENWKDNLTLIKRENVHVMNKRALERHYDTIMNKLGQDI